SKKLKKPLRNAVAIWPKQFYCFNPKPLLLFQTLSFILVVIWTLSPIIKPGHTDIFEENTEF
ncbi:MAG TPA: hypothetical protein VLL96_06950, partial [Candidatus Deferrimicrobiaceae bacterium]|nr:hypothetical protein [Candidatus Deferrimicrobiaceae bacterium]